MMGMRSSDIGMVSGAREVGRRLILADGRKEMLVGVDVARWPRLGWRMSSCCWEGGQSHFCSADCGKIGTVPNACAVFWAMAGRGGAVYLRVR